MAIPLRAIIGKTETSACFQELPHAVPSVESGPRPSKPEEPAMRHSVAGLRTGKPVLQHPIAGTIRSGKKPGRNKPCPCGSGKKWKRCCGGPPEPHHQPRRKPIAVPRVAGAIVEEVVIRQEVINRTEEK